MKEMTTKERITQLAEQKVAEKRAVQEKKMQETLDRDIADVGTILEAIKNKLLYKKGKNYWEAWQLVTEEMFYEDYLRTTEYGWQKGIRFRNDERSNIGEYVEVNGELYFDMRYLINTYALDLEKAIKNNRLEYDKLKEKKEHYDALVHDEPHIKSLMQEYLLRKHEVEE